MAGGKIETDPKKLADRCEQFKIGVQNLYDGDGPMNGDMWLFELYHHLTDCTTALRTRASAQTIGIRNA